MPETTKPPRPDCIMWKRMHVRNWEQYVLPNVPLDEQVFVSDPRDPEWTFTVHQNDEAALRSWLDWYHSKEQP
jgi:hypothetical protein